MKNCDFTNGKRGDLIAFNTETLGWMDMNGGRSHEWDMHGISTNHTIAMVLVMDNWGLIVI